MRQHFISIIRVDLLGWGCISMSNFEKSIKDQIDKAMDNLKCDLEGKPPKWTKVKHENIIHYTKYKCIKSHIRTGQDIHGRIEFNVSDIISVQTGSEMWVINTDYFIKIGEYYLKRDFITLK